MLRTAGIESHGFRDGRLKVECIRGDVGDGLRWQGGWRRRRAACRRN